MALQASPWDSLTYNSNPASSNLRGAPPAPGTNIFGMTPTPAGASGSPNANNFTTGSPNQNTNMWTAPNAATLNLGAIPQVPESTQLQALLNGQGFTPQALAQMSATAMEAPAAAGTQALAQGKIAAQQAGLGESPATQAAIASTVGRQTGQAQQAAETGVSLANAQQAIQNQQFGIQGAQQLALQNAAMLFAGMQSNQNARLTTQAQLGGWS